MKHRAVMSTWTRPDGTLGYIAHLLDCNIAVQANTEEEAKQELALVIWQHRYLTAKHSFASPFDYVGPAPEHVQKLWDTHGFMLEEHERSAG